MLNTLKRINPNVYTLIIALGISLWFEGMNTIISFFIKERTIYTGIALCSVALMIFYSDDGKFNELYNTSENNKNAAATISSFKREY